MIARALCPVSLRRRYERLMRNFLYVTAIAAVSSTSAAYATNVEVSFNAFFDAPAVPAARLSYRWDAYPVADEEPCTTREMAEFWAKLLQLPALKRSKAADERKSRFASNRRVDGSAIRRLLGITLAYPSYRVGVPAALSASREE